MGNIYYKYKSCSDLDKTALSNNQLWVSSIEGMNDPIDFLVELDLPYCTENRETISAAQSFFLKDYACIAFSTTAACKRLWNYYTDGMRGFILCYDSDDIENALNLAGYYSPSDNNRPNGSKLFYSGLVNYDGKRTNMTEYYKNVMGEPDAKTQVVLYNSFLHKDDSWKDEKEYRYVYKFDPFKVSEMLKDKVPTNKIGFLLNDLSPKEIIIGYRMSTENREAIRTYCDTRNIKMFEMSPTFTKGKGNYFVKRELNVHDGTCYNYTEIIPYE